MIPALRISASGMVAQQINLDVIANNLANVNTAGFRKSRAEFSDLLYRIVNPTGGEPFQLGQGCRVSSVTKMFHQGSLISSGDNMSLAIEGEGFFRVSLPDGRVAYTRNGNLSLSGDGRLMMGGYLLEPQITVPEGSSDLEISVNGEVSVMMDGETDPEIIGNIFLVRFTNPEGLNAMGDSLYLETEACGLVTEGMPGDGGFGSVRQGYMEGSNVSVVDEMVRMMMSQRAYQMNSRAVTTADQMLETANQILRR